MKEETYFSPLISQFNTAIVENREKVERKLKILKITKNI